MYDVVMKAFDDYADLQCMGTRKFDHFIHEKGARMPIKVFSGIEWRTYKEVKERALEFGRGLRHLGLTPLLEEDNRDVLENFGGLKGGNCMLIFENTSEDWTTATLGAMSQSITVATSYATLGMPAVVTTLQETNAPVILCNYNDVEKVSNMQDSCPGLQTIVYTRLNVEHDKPPPNRSAGRLNVISFDEVVNAGKAHPEIEETPPTPDHVGLIMYTSGSTGTPKGVMLKHSSITASVAGLEAYFNDNVSKRATNAATQEVYLAYLPAAHILEFAAEMSMLTHGARIGYGDLYTLTETLARIKLEDGKITTENAGGLAQFKPTLLAGAPKVWDIFMKKILAGVNENPVKKALVGVALWARGMALAIGRDTPVFNLILFNKVHARFGGAVKVGVSGGGPCSTDLQKFITLMLKFPLVQGYGLTETCSCGTLQPKHSYEQGVAGSPVKSVQIKLKSCEDVVDSEMKPYQSNDTKHLGTRCNGRGEVLIKGKCVSSGYYTKRVLTEEVFADDGWFHTGDIAIWTSNGMLKIVDRLKNLIKLKGGEYVAIEAMESTYGQCVLVQGLNGGILCYGDGDMDRPVALVQVNIELLCQWADSQGIEYEDAVALCAMKEATTYVVDELNKVGKGKLARNETLAAVALLPGTGPLDGTTFDCPWTPQNQYLTASNKLNRNPIKNGLKSVLEEVKGKEQKREK